MKTETFRKSIEAFYEVLRKQSDELASVRLSEDKWSLKEMVGHMIDSASNNHQRFTRLQQQSELQFPAYEAEPWIAVEKPRDCSWETLSGLWYEYNKFLLHIVSTIDEKALSHVWIKGSEKLSLSHLVEDYFRHLEWHRELFDSRLKELQQSG